MRLNFAVVLAVGSLCVSLVSCWYSLRTHKRLYTIKKCEAARDLKLKQLYRERVQKEYPEQVSKIKAEFAARGLAASGQCKKALAGLKSAHERVGSNIGFKSLTGILRISDRFASYANFVFPNFVPKIRQKSEGRKSRKLLKTRWLPRRL